MLATFRHTEFRADELAARKAESVSVVLPARQVADTIGPIVEALLELDGLIDQLLVVDAASDDGTADVARALGADVVQEADLLPELGPVCGKGDAMWRSLAATRGEIVTYIDSDTTDFEGHFATGLLGPLLTCEEVQFVKGAYSRPFAAGEVDLPHGGGRVTELMARPLLSAFYPELAAFVQPLAGEMAARRPLLESVPFGTGYSVETAMLIDVHAAVGLPAMAQVDLGERRNAHQPLTDLGSMAYAVLQAVLERVKREGRPLELPLPPFQRADGEVVVLEPLERPPFASLRSRA